MWSMLGSLIASLICIELFYLTFAAIFKHEVGYCITAIMFCPLAIIQLFVFGDWTSFISYAVILVLIGYFPIFQIRNKRKYPVYLYYLYNEHIIRIDIENLSFGFEFYENNRWVKNIELSKTLFSDYQITEENAIDLINKRNLDKKEQEVLPMEKKLENGVKVEYYAGVGSTVTYKELDTGEIAQVTIVKSTGREIHDEVSVDTELGKALLGCKKGEVKEVNSIEPYTISILEVLNPIEKRNIRNQKPVDIDDRTTFDIFIPAQAGNYANFQSRIYNGLYVMHAYGTTAKDIYKAGVDNFDWDGSKTGKFGQQKLLYDLDCTGEGYSVWFLPYSNLTAIKNKNANWENYISSDFKLIKESWNNINSNVDFFYDNTKRITFIKQKNGQYVYIGIFQAQKIDPSTKCKYYKRIGEDYK